jgi:hypothetical protein
MARADAAGTPGRVALVHNGIIENHEELRAALQAKGYVFASQTDTEVIAHLVDSHYNGDLFDAVQCGCGRTAWRLRHRRDAQGRAAPRGGRARRFATDSGRGRRMAAEHFLASDAMALAGVTDQIVYLEEGDLVDLQLGRYWIVGKRTAQALTPAQRPVRTVQAHSGAAELGPYRHYMQKEIFEQPRAIADTLEGVEGIVPELFDGPACTASPARRLARVQGDRPRAHPGLRHQLLQRLHGQILARGASPASPPRWKWPANTATAPACPTRAAWWSPSAKGRNRRHPGRVAPRAAWACSTR